jgi:hypothetical protein
MKNKQEGKRVAAVKGLKERRTRVGKAKRGSLKREGEMPTAIASSGAAMDGGS